MRFQSFLRKSLWGAAMLVCVGLTSPAEAVLDVFIEGVRQENPTILRRPAWEMLATEYRVPTTDLPANIPENPRLKPGPGAEPCAVVVDVPPGKQAQISVRMGDLDSVATSIILSQMPMLRHFRGTPQGIALLSQIIVMMNNLRVRIDVVFQDLPRAPLLRKDILTASEGRIGGVAEVVKDLVRERDEDQVLTLHSGGYLPAVLNSQTPLRFVPWPIGNIDPVWFVTSQDHTAMGYRCAKRVSQAEQIVEGIFTGVERLFIDINSTVLWTEEEAFIVIQAAIHNIKMIWKVCMAYLLFFGDVVPPR